jgi:uncharacterized DUF497 family protein
MSELRFQWAESKNRSNERKHGIFFEEAQTVFFDEDALEFYDRSHAEQEDRFLMLGQSFRYRTLMICHCYREPDDVIRIISARKATAKERKIYQENKP